MKAIAREEKMASGAANALRYLELRNRKGNTVLRWYHHANDVP